MKRIIIIILFLNASVALSQQAWTQKKGEGYFQISSSFTGYDQVFDNNSENQPIPWSISQTIVSAYGEYGLSDRLMATLVVPFHLTSTGDSNLSFPGIATDGGEISAMGNIDAALTYKLIDKNSFVFSSKLNIGLPTASFDDNTGLRTGYDGMSITPSILLGRGTSKYFTSAEAGARIISNGYSPQFIFNAQLGKKFLKSEKLLLILGMNILAPLGEASVIDNFELDGNASYTGLYLNEQSYYAWNVKVGYYFTKKISSWVSLGGGTAKNVGLSPGISLSVGYNLKKQ